MAKDKLIPFNGLVGQERVKDILLTSKKRSKLAHAYLFLGPTGLGKDAAALAIAFWLNCDNEIPGGCRECDHCRRIRRLEQPGFRYIFPVPARPKSMKEQRYSEIIREKMLRRIENPYVGVDFYPEFSTLPAIGIDQIRSLKREVMLKLSGKQVRIFIISHADRMTLSAANSLLKLLEEPPEDTHLILTSSLSNQLLPTLISRCQVLRFSLLKDEEIQNALVEQWHIASDRAALLARLAGGSLERALALTEPEFEEKRESALSFLIGALSRDTLKSLSEADSLLVKYDKAGIRDVLQFLLVFLGDVFQLQSGSLKDLTNQDHFSALEKFVNRYPSFNSRGAIRQVERAIDFLEKNVYLHLILHHLTDEMNRSNES